VLSYRHAYHAGSPADVVKHAVWTYVLQDAARYGAPYCAIDSHAGAGWYDLTRPMPEKLGEYRQGILKVLRAPSPTPELLAPFLELVRQANPDRALTRYPGSPAIATQCLREGDRLELIELHPTDSGTLHGRYGRQRATQVYQGDALEILPTRVPPREGRGVILVDPSFEIKNDYARVPEAVASARRRFPRGTYLIWYPVIERPRAAELVRALASGGQGNALHLELRLRPDGSARGMTGSGLVVVNPPPRLEHAAEELFPWLATLWEATGGYTIGWLARE
jgi:23S rRNA (adenine2030-N6)-methyltransferase